MTTAEFFNILFETAQEGKSYIWTLQPKITYQSEDFNDLAEIAEEQNLAGMDVYFSVGLTNKSLNYYERAKNEDIIGIPALWVDIDIADNTHKAENLPPDYESAKALLPPMKPSIIVFSGHGIHAYYMFREILETKTTEEKIFAKNLLRRLQNYVRQKAEVKGWHVDSTIDLSRVLRVPNTINRKKGLNVLCEVRETDFTNHGYNPTDFDDFFMPIEESSENKNHKVFERRDSDGNASLMLANCKFLQNWQLNYKTLPEPVWKAACTNLIRGVDGEKVILPLVQKWQGEKFNQKETLKKLNHYLNECQPQTCEYIQKELGFTNCGKCEGVKAPCSWSLATVPQALATILSIISPSAENVFVANVLKSLAILKKESFGNFAKFKEKCKGRINLNDLERQIKKYIEENDSENNAYGVSLTEGQRSGEVTTCKAIANTPLNLILPENFSFGINGVYEVKVTNYGTKYVLASGNPIIISRKIYNIDTNTEKIELAFLYHEHWKRFFAKRSDVFSARQIVNFADSGLNISSESAKPLIRYLQRMETLNPEIPMVHAVSKIGWRNDSLKEFILPSINQKYIIDVNDDGNVTEAYRQSGDFTQWRNFALHIRQYQYARFFLSTSFAPSLLKILNERNFMVFFWGTSTGGKTAALHFAISAWGKPEELMRSFYGTLNGLERAAAYSNDYPLPINERQVMQGSNKQEALETLAYLLEGGRGKERASREGLRKTPTWKTISMATGEEPLSTRSSVQGVKTRIIELNTSSVLPNELAKNVYAFTSNNYGTAGAIYIKKLLEENQTGFHDIYEARREISAYLSKKFSECLDPHIDAISLICTADFLISQWLFDLAPKQAADEAKNLAEYIAKQMPSKKEISDTERAWQFVIEWILSNQRRFEGATKNIDNKITPDYGFIRKGFYNIYPTYLEEALEKVGFRPNKILKEFADKDLISTIDEGEMRRFKIRVSYNGARVYVIQIPMEKFEDKQNA